MRSKIVWLSFCITMVYWLGGVMGCATSSHDTENYRILNEEKDIFNPSLPGNGINDISLTMPIVQVQLASLDIPQTVIESTTTQKSAVIEATSRNWDHLVTGPDQGITEHLPHHFKDCSFLMSAREQVDFEQPLTDQMNAALADANCQKFQPLDIIAAVGQPAKFAMDVATWPIVAVTLEPLWSPIHTPAPNK